MLEKKARRTFVIIIKEVVELGFAGRLFIAATAARRCKILLKRNKKLLTING